MATEEEYRRAEEVVREMLRAGVMQINLSQEQIIWLAQKTKTWDYRKWQNQEVPDSIGKVDFSR